jgi:hypothetical protein
MGLAPSVGKVFFPLDEELELLPGSLAPRQQEHVVHLASWMPFEKAANMVEDLLGVQTDEETVRRLSEQAGRWMQQAQEAEVEAMVQNQSQDYLQRCALSVDGAMVPLVKQQWAETRTLAIGEPVEKCTTDGKREIHVERLSYFSRLANACAFTDLAEVEMRRRGVQQAKQVGAVTDGADWCQSFTDLHRPDAVRILDFPHAAQHIGKLLEALEKAGVSLPPRMLERCLHVLKHRGPRFLFRIADHLRDELTQKEGVREHLSYLRKREAMMQYPEFRRQGWPIGSGMVESANKNVVEMRLKGPGMHWERQNVNPMLALRNAVCNGRWQEMWRKSLQQYKKQKALSRELRTRQRAEACLARCDPALLSSPPLPPPSQSPSSQTVSSPPPAEVRPTATLPGSSRPSAYHPWKRGPACRPKAS